MKKIIRALNKIELYFEMDEWRKQYPNVTFSDICHKVESNGYEYWFVLATV